MQKILAIIGGYTMTASTVINNVVIRSAGTDGLLISWFRRSIRYRAHAQRIFDTHMEGGIDHVGHFSAGFFFGNYITPQVR